MTTPTRTTVGTWTDPAYRYIECSACRWQTRLPRRNALATVARLRGMLSEHQKTCAAFAAQKRPHGEHLRYLGALGLLGECAVYVPEDLREMIEAAFTDATAADPALKWRRVLNRLEIEVTEAQR